MIENIRKEVNNWWLSLLLGILFLATGVWVIFTPISSYITLSIFFSAVILVSGISQIIFSISNKNNLHGWGWHLTSGILDLIIGVILLIYPKLSMVVLPYFVGFWLLFAGFSSIAMAVEAKKVIGRVSVWGIIFGILVAIFAFLLIINPLFAAVSIVYMTAFAFGTLGIFRIIYAFHLKKIKSKFKE